MLLKQQDDFLHRGPLSELRAHAAAGPAPINLQTANALLFSNNNNHSITHSSRISSFRLITLLWFYWMSFPNSYWVSSPNSRCYARVVKGEVTALKQPCFTAPFRKDPVNQRQRDEADEPAVRHPHGGRWRSENITVLKHGGISHE